MSDPHGVVPCLGEIQGVDAFMFAQSSRGSTGPACDFAEGKVWDALGGGWQCLYGCYCQSGISVEWHDFACEESVDWHRSFHPESLELCLNVSGRARMECGGDAVAFGPRAMGFYRVEGNALKAWRLPGERHQFLTVEFSHRYLVQHLEPHLKHLHPVLRRMLRRKGSPCWASSVDRLDSTWLNRILVLREPPVSDAARGVWYQGQVLALVAEFLFAEPKGEAVQRATPRKSRLARARVDRVKRLLEENLDASISLENLGREVGCSPHYLSRTFSGEMGMTIQQYRRQIRMERAAQLLKSGKFNVTETALEVGYSSLSHFSHAFCEVIGCCPGLYPLGLNLPGPASRASSTRESMTSDRQ